MDKCTFKCLPSNSTTINVGKHLVNVMISCIWTQIKAACNKHFSRN